MNGTPRRVVMSLSLPAISCVRVSPSITQGPAMRNNGRSMPTWKLASSTGYLGKEWRRIHVRHLTHAAPKRRDRGCRPAWPGVNGHVRLRAAFGAAHFVAMTYMPGAVEIFVRNIGPARRKLLAANAILAHELLMRDHPEAGFLNQAKVNRRRLAIDHERTPPEGDLPQAIGTGAIAIPSGGKSMRLEIDLVRHPSTGLDPLIQRLVRGRQIHDVLEHGMGNDEIDRALLDHARIEPRRLVLRRNRILRRRSGHGAANGLDARRVQRLVQSLFTSGCGSETDVHRDTN